MRTTLAKLAAARAHTPPGYIDALLAAGHMDADGIHHHIAPATLLDIRAKFGVLRMEDGRLRMANAAAAAIPHPLSSTFSYKRGLGDRVAAIAQPIARALDAVLGTNLKNCPKCKQRQAALNAAFPAAPERGIHSAGTHHAPRSLNVPAD